MNRIRQGWDALRRGRRSGVSLVIALCAVAVLIGLSLSIVYSSSMLLSRANRKIGRERCYQLAQSFAQVLDSELTAYNPERTRQWASLPAGTWRKVSDGVHAGVTPFGPCFRDALELAPTSVTVLVAE
mgnify:CR=1 FL=1